MLKSIMYASYEVFIFNGLLLNIAAFLVLVQFTVHTCMNNCIITKSSMQQLKPVS